MFMPKPLTAGTWRTQYVIYSATTTKNSFGMSCYRFAVGDQGEKPFGRGIARRAPRWHKDLHIAAESCSKEMLRPQATIPTQREHSDWEAKANGANGAPKPDLQPDGLTSAVPAASFSSTMSTCGLPLGKEAPKRSNIVESKLLFANPKAKPGTARERGSTMKSFSSKRREEIPRVYCGGVDPTPIMVC
jgi:hypothetical protein